MQAEQNNKTVSLSILFEVKKTSVASEGNSFCKIQSYFILNNIVIPHQSPNNLDEVRGG